MNKFEIESEFQPSGDQPQAIKKVIDNLQKGATEDIYKNCIDINKRIEPYKRIKKFYLTFEDFEKTSTQKIKRSFLKNIDLTKYTLTR